MGLEEEVKDAVEDEVGGGVHIVPSRLPCFVFCICVLTYRNRNLNANKLSWGLG